MESIEKQQKML